MYRSFTTAPYVQKRYRFPHNYSAKCSIWPSLGSTVWKTLRSVYFYPECQCKYLNSHRRPKPKNQRTKTEKKGDYRHGTDQRVVYSRQNTGKILIFYLYSTSNFLVIASRTKTQLRGHCCIHVSATDKLKHLDCITEKSGIGSRTRIKANMQNKQFICYSCVFPIVP